MYDFISYLSEVKILTEKNRCVNFMKNRPRGYKTFFMLKSVEHEILNAHRCKIIKKFGSFSAQISQ